MSLYATHTYSHNNTQLYLSLTHTHILTITHKDSYKIPTVFDCIFSIPIHFILLTVWWLFLSSIEITLRWGFLIWELIFIFCGLFVLMLVVFVLFLLSLRFGQISPLAFFRWFTATSDRNAESCNRIPSNYCLP